jgi:hypothetical protein
MKIKVSREGIFSVNKKLESIAKVEKETAREVGEAVVKEMLDQIGKGVSPIRGEGRFPRYKNPKKYPADQKPKSPVNLKLTGQMLDSLKFSVYSTRTGFGTEIQYSNQEAKLKEKGHRDGANGQPKRPTIPLKSLGETFSARIIRLIRDIYSTALKRKL